jgi:hypothetical protein
MASRGARRQALFHLRLAAVYDGILRDHALWKASGLARSSEDLLSAFPPDLPGATLLAELCKKATGPVQIACWREVVARDTKDAHAKRELARGLLEVLEGSAEPCLGLRALECKRELRSRLGEAGAVLKDWPVMELRARELAMEGNLRDATALLLEHCPATREAAACCQRAVEFARRAKDLSLLGAAADRYAAAVCYDPRSCALAHELIGRSYAELSAVGVASRHFMMAAEQDPSADRWLQSAEASARAGSAISARVAFDRARREGPLSAEQIRRVEAVQAMLEGIPRPN